MKKLSQIDPYLFENQLIIAISNEWISVFGRIPRFDVIFDDEGRLILQSEPAQQEFRGKLT